MEAEEAAEILDAIGGMCIQYGSAGLERSKIMADWPKSRDLLLDVLVSQIMPSVDDSGLIDEDCVSAQEHAITVLLKHRRIEEVKRQRWWRVGKRDQRPSGYYLIREPSVS